MRISEFKLTTPILFLVFNRLETTKQVFQEIRKAKPTKLYIAADGPRKKEEKRKTDAVRKYILDNIDWKCKVKKLFRRKNLGCKYAVSGAIDWFFENEEQGMILEDDCLPSQSFFRFCQDLLERYKDDKKVMHISGTNVEGISKIKEDYFFSNTFNVWGWATWKRAWKYYDVKINEWSKYNSINGLKRLGFSGLVNMIRLKKNFNLTYKGKLDTWDYQWDFSCKINKGISIIPSKNLITNIGIHSGTHTGKGVNMKFKIVRKEMNNENLEKGKNERYPKKFYTFFRESLIKYLLEGLLNENTSK